MLPLAAIQVLQLLAQLGRKQVRRVDDVACLRLHIAQKRSLALDAVGHTPGHTAFQVSNLLVIGDLMHGYALQKDHPEINSNYDMDKEKSIESRKRLMQYSRDNKLTMAGMHLPPPGFAE